MPALLLPAFLLPATWVMSALLHASWKVATKHMGGYRCVTPVTSPLTGLRLLGAAGIAAAATAPAGA
jgi:hypothetical protein